MSKFATAPKESVYFPFTNIAWFKVLKKSYLQTLPDLRNLKLRNYMQYLKKLK